MKSPKNNLNERDYEQLGECFYTTFKTYVNNRQIDKLISLYPDWKGNMDVEGVAELMNGILKHFIKMDIPLYESPQSDKDEFYRRIADSKMDFIQFISIDTTNGRNLNQHPGLN